MKTHQLLSFVPKKRGGGLFWVGLVLLAVAAADQFYLEMLGSLVTAVWGVGGILILVSVLMRAISSSSQSASLQIESEGIIVQYGDFELPIPFEDIQLISSGKVAQHHSLKTLDGRERTAVQPYFNQTHVFIEFHQATEELKQAKEHMPSFLFGTKKVGILLPVAGDWIPLERDIDAARVEWVHRLKAIHDEEHRATYADPRYKDSYYDDDDDDDEEDSQWGV